MTAGDVATSATQGAPDPGRDDPEYSDRRPAPDEDRGRGGSVQRTLGILEVVASRGGATAREIADDTGLPLPSVYRLIRELLDGEYLVHLRDEQRFELGYKLHALGVSLHQQIGISRQTAAEIAALHNTLGAAAYLAIHRGTQIVVVHTVDSPAHPRLPPIGFGFHEAAHATALGKIQLATMTDEQRTLHLDPEPYPRFTPQTMTGRAELDAQLEIVADNGIAWEFGELVAGYTCAAAAVRGASGVLLGSVAVSGPTARFARESERQSVARALRATAARVGRQQRGLS